MSERLLARPRDARALGGAGCCEHVLSAKGSREAFGRGAGAKVRTRHVSVHVWMDAPLTTHVTLNMMDFDGREVAGRSAKSFEVLHVSSTHRLSAKGSRDASLALCVLRARARGVSAVVCADAPLRPV